MSLFLIFIFSLLFIFLGRVIFKNWFNHIVFYTAIWGGMLFLYELKLLKYHSLTMHAWIVIIGSFLSFIIGTLTYTYSKGIFKEAKPTIRPQYLGDFQSSLKFIKITILVTATISLLGALQHWAVLFNKYGSLPSILINANEIYRLRVQDEIPGVLPYLSIFGFVAVFFAAIESGIKKKFTILSLYSLLGVIIKEFALLGRHGILTGFIEYFVVLYFIRKIINSNKTEIGSFRIERGTIVSTILLIIFFVTSIALVKNVRGAFESYRSSTKELNKLKGGFLITPSIYLYASSHVGVLSRYLFENSESNNFGENTFLPAHRIISKFGVINPPSYYQKGYNIPMWTNTGTYLRELYSDFGPIGVFLIPYLLGLITTFFWYRLFLSGNLIDLLIISHLYLIIIMSFLTMSTRSSNFIMSFVIIYLLLKMLDKFCANNENNAT